MKTPRPTGNAGLRASYWHESFGTWVSVYDARAALIDNEGRWAVVCELHGSILDVETLELAKADARDRDPGEFCADCRLADVATTDAERVDVLVASGQAADELEAWGMLERSSLDANPSVCFNPESSNQQPTGGPMAEAPAQVTKIGGLTRDNVRALEETHRDAIASGNLSLGKTWAKWQVSAQAALFNLDGIMSGLPTKGHPRASLHAVARKLDKEAQAQHQARMDTPMTEDEDDAPAWIDINEEDTHNDESHEVGRMDPAADFLLDLTWPNLFEPVDSKPGRFGPFRCKGCSMVIDARNRERHFKTHKENRTMSTSDTPAKPKVVKETAKDQGFPAAYLAPNGNFRPGMDARAKSDLCAQLVGQPNKDALATFTDAQAQKLIDARGWQGFVDRKREIVAKKAKDAEVKAEKKAADIKERAEAKKNAPAKDEPKKDGEQTIAEAAAADGDPVARTEVKPDTKPAPKARTGRGRK